MSNTHGSIARIESVELAIGNVVRRVLYIIREEHVNALKMQSTTARAHVDAPPKSSSSSHSYQSRSLGTILTPGTDTDLSLPIADLKLVRLDSDALVVASIRGCIAHRPLSLSRCMARSSR